MEDVGSEIKLSPMGKWLMAIAIASILIYVFRQIRIQAIKEKIEALKAEYINKAEALAVMLKSKATLDEEAAKFFSVIATYVLCAFVVVLVVIVLNIGWSVELWSAVIGIVLIFLSIGRSIAATVYRLNAGFKDVVELCRRWVQLWIYKRDGFDEKIIPSLQVELARNKSEQKELRIERRELERPIVFLFEDLDIQEH